MTAVWSGKTAAARSRNVSGVSGWKFAGLRSRSVSYGVGAMAPSSVEASLAGYRAKDQLPLQVGLQIGHGAKVSLPERQNANPRPRRIDRDKCSIEQFLLR